MLAGMIQAPEDYNPFHQYKAAKERQEVVLDRMQYLGWITPAEAKAAKKTKIILGEPTAWRGSKLPYVTDTVIKEIKDRFGDETLRKGGLRIQTTVDYDIQKKGEAVVQNAYKRLRGGLKGKNLQLALVSVDPRTHFIKTIVGGVDYEKSQLNRALQSRRRLGHPLNLLFITQPLLRANILLIQSFLAAESEFAMGVIFTHLKTMVAVIQAPCPFAVPLLLLKMFLLWSLVTKWVLAKLLKRLVAWESRVRYKRLLPCPSVPLM